MRQVIPELLDSLPHDAPEAVRSRRELRMINGIMGNHRWLRRQLRHHIKPQDRVLELGAGDGVLAQQAFASGLLQPCQWSALDLAPAPAAWPLEARWHQANLLALPVLPEAEILVANLFLHHFQDADLAALGRKIPGACRRILACEPARRRRHSLQGKALSAVARLSAVTRHDMEVSIGAGFLADELQTALGLVGWECEVSLTFLGAYHFSAWR